MPKNRSYSQRKIHCPSKSQSRISTPFHLDRLFTYLLIHRIGEREDERILNKEKENNNKNNTLFKLNTFATVSLKMSRQKNVRHEFEIVSLFTVCYRYDMNEERRMSIVDNVK